jgi:uncharacterized protein (DUF1330 family)
MNAITPNREQFAALAAAAKDDEGPVVMLNLLKFKGAQGQAEYGRYGGAVRDLVGQSGGRLLYVGLCDQVLIGDPSEEWDAVALVEYPSRRAFIEMVSRPDYQQAHTYREAGLERTILIATSPTEPPGAGTSHG